MASYTTLSPARIRKLFAAYGLAEVETYEPLSGGLENTSFLVITRAERYVLTLLEQKSFQGARQLANLLVYLSSHEFYTSRVVKSLAGDLIVSFHDKPVLLKYYIAGEITADLSDDTLAAIGGQMARLHRIPPPSYLPQEYGYGQQAFGALYTREIEAPFVGWLQEKHAFIRDNLRDELPRAFIHGDVFYDNVIRSQAGVAITDFEEACYYYRIFDLAMAVVGMCAPEGSIFLPKVKALIAGYEAVQTLNPTEKKRFRAFIVYAATAATFWRYRQYHVIHPDESMKNHHEAMMRIADDAFCRSDEEFQQPFL